MENLNDVEFGSNENQEEAPILIAQRHLNIFRQVHIFNKAKRDQFDDELLALPDVVINYIKKMPGGRLLIEHLEDVKTKRGISFVKSSRDDFISPDDTPSVPTAATAGVPAQYVGGSVTMDASFAETFAKSMAEAFKQMPTPTITTSGVASAALPADFRSLIEAITEEIRASRASLLDVLKETRSITDSVIASQVSISRILEGILASQNKGDTDTATMNNRIIASQASITKLLENLYTANTQRNDEVSAYLDVDNKLQDFRTQLEQTINNSLSSIVNHVCDTANKQSVDIVALDVEKRLATFKSELETDILKSLANLQITAPISQEYNNNQPKAAPIQERQFSLPQSALVNDDSEQRRKKKKKKKKGLDFAADAEQKFNSAVLSSTSSVAVSDEEISNSDGSEQIEGIIRNSDYPHEDTFDNVDLNIPPLESNDFKGTASNIDNNNSLDDLMEDDLDFVLPKQGSALTDNDSDTDINDTASDLSSLSHLMSDDLDFELPAQGSALDTENVKDQGPILEVPEFNNTDTLDSLMGDDANDEDVEPNFNEAVNTEQSEQETEENIVSLDDLSSLDSLMSDDANDEDVEPNFNEAVNTEQSKQESVENPVSLDDLSSLDSLMGDDANSENVEPNFNEAVNTEQSEQESVENPVSLDDFSSLDSLMSEDANSENVEPDFNEAVNTEQSEQESEENPVSLDDLSSLDSLMSEDANSEASSQEFADATEIDADNDTSNFDTSSRYSAELDKIRAALTSDNIDISSLDKPIALDDYDDDANVSEDDVYADSGYEETRNDELSANSNITSNSVSTPEKTLSDEDWEWEYVDENGNPISADEANTNDQDWEWEYVEDDSSNAEDNNKSE